jgi:hypothetical protein
VKTGNEKIKMLKRKSKSKTLRFYIVNFAFCFLSLNCLTPSRLLAQDPNAPYIQMLHIAVRADTEEVHFENIWVFKRQSEGRPWQATIELPPAAVLVAVDEPNQTQFLPDSKTIRKEMPPDSLIDSVGFTFTLPNQNGACQTSISPAYPTANMLVSVSGRATKFTGKFFKYDDFRTSRSRFSSVYTAADIPPDTAINMALTSLPQPDGPLAEYISIAGLALTIGIALSMILCRRKERNIAAEPQNI